MKILFLFNEGFDTPGPSNHLMLALVEDVLKSGISVHMVESHRLGKNEDIPEELKVYTNLTYDIVPRETIVKDAFIRRYFEEIGYAFKSFRRWKHVKDYDVIFIQSSPTAIYNLLLAKLFGRNKPLIYNIQDIFPGSAICSGAIRSNLVGFVFRTLQKAAYKLSDRITVISDDMLQKVVNQNVNREKITTIVNWYDDSSVHEVPWKENRFVEKYNLSKDIFYVQYAGTMGFVFDYKMVLNVAELLKNYKNIEFQMVGQGSQMNDFIKEKEEQKLDNIVFYPFESQDMVSDVYSTCSICLIPLKRGIIGNSVPSKAGLLMACNRAIVNSVDEDSYYYRMFHENNMGISVSNNNPRATADAILTLYEEKELRKQFARNGQEFGKHYYARRVNTVKYIELFKVMVGEE